MKNESGQTLIEVLAALTAAVVIVAAIVSASLSALTNSEYSRDQNIASQFTQQGMEIIREMRNQNITSLNVANLPDNTYCLAKTCAALTANISSCWVKNPSCGQNVDKFVRQVVVTHNSSDCNATPTPMQQAGILATNVKITVTTSWYDSKCTDSSNPFCHLATVSSCFSDFTTNPTP